MLSVEKPILLLDQHISDLREHASGVNLDIEMRQLDAGPPRARIAVMATSKCVVFRGEYERAYHQVGHTPADVLTIGIPDPVVGEFRWCSKKSSGSNITNFSLENGFDGICGAGFAGFAISVRHDLLQQTCETLELDIDFKKILRSSEVWPHSEHVANRLRSQALAAFGSVRFSNNTEAIEFFNFSAAASILNYLATSRIPGKRPSIRARSCAARAALEYLEDTETLPLTVSELCSKTGVSAPTIYRAFQEQFGVGPKRYIQIRRLNGVRQELLAKNSSASVADIANYWGFWHMGQFAADYRKHFSELPSETLDRSK